MQKFYFINQPQLVLVMNDTIYSAKTKKCLSNQFQMYLFPCSDCSLLDQELDGMRCLFKLLCLLFLS